MIIITNYISEGLTLKEAISIFLMVIVVSGLLWTANLGIMRAESSIPKPSIPEFTLKFMDNSYDVPPTYGIDPYTGKNVMTKAGHRIENKTIEVTIKNQPFSYYYDDRGNFVGQYYNIRFKGHFESYWHQVKADNIYHLPHYLPSSYSEYTTTSFGLGDDYVLDVAPGGQVDFQVMAFIGYYNRISDGPTPLGEAYHYVFTGESSDWSSTQMVTIGESTSTTTPDMSPTQNPTAQLDQTGTQVTVSQSGVGWTEVGLFTVAGIIIALLIVNVVYMKRRRTVPKAA